MGQEGKVSGEKKAGVGEAAAAYQTKRREGERYGVLFFSFYVL